MAGDRTMKRLIAECEAEPGYRCSLYSFLGGNTYRLFRNLEIRDVRLAYAPPGSIGNYGGEVDNWMWPRHTGDFSLLRAYVGEDGKPAAYSPDNVPYQPEQFLVPSPEGVNEGDFVAAGQVLARMDTEGIDVALMVPGGVSGTGNAEADHILGGGFPAKYLKKVPLVKQ